ncbi:hypothetical protein BJ742DRAFT_767265 [Cladochytrium replicatum]|nr:hypothetical protein BJ742DRAFT_767265 [Cladochytrium replicatum]
MPGAVPIQIATNPPSLTRRFSLAGSPDRVLTSPVDVLHGSDDLHEVGSMEEKHSTAATHIQISPNENPVDRASSPPQKQPVKPKPAMDTRRRTISLYETHSSSVARLF